MDLFENGDDLQGVPEDAKSSDQNLIFWHIQLQCILRWKTFSGHLGSYWTISVE